MRHCSTTYRRRELRSHMTVHEIRFWFRLKQRGLLGYKFRRQHPVGSYIVDFYCPELMLAIELDGGHHFEKIQHENDLVRQHFIEKQGIMVVRYPNSEINDDIDIVFEDLARRIRGRRSEMPRRFPPRPVG